MINSNTQKWYYRKSVECGSIAGILLLGVYAKCMGGRSDVLSLYMSQFSFLNSTSLCAHIGFSGVSYQ
jgi:hypothetical protein